MRLQDKGNRFVIVDKDTDCLKAQQQIACSSFTKLDHDLTYTHIQKVQEWADKWKERGKIRKSWQEFIVNDDAQPGKNLTLYKIHKHGSPIRLLTTGCNTAIKNLFRFIEKMCAPLTNNTDVGIKETENLLQIIDNININGLPNNAILISFDTVNMFLNIDNVKGTEAAKLALQNRPSQKPSKNV